jgi:hypothetical protein
LRSVPLDVEIGDGLAERAGNGSAFDRTWLAIRSPRRASPIPDDRHNRNNRQTRANLCCRASLIESTEIAQAGRRTEWLADIQSIRHDPR